MAKKASKKTFLLLVVGLLGLLFLFKMKSVYEGFGTGTAKEDESCKTIRDLKTKKDTDDCSENLFCMEGICKRDCGGKSGSVGDRFCKDNEYCGDKNGKAYCAPLNGKVRFGSDCTNSSSCVSGTCKERCVKKETKSLN